MSNPTILTRPLALATEPTDVIADVAAAVPANESLRIEPFDDALVERLGHDPRSRYVETFWLGTLGPSTLLLLRHLSDGLAAAPGGFDLDLSVCAVQLGLGDRDGKNGPFQRAFARLEQFGLAARRGNAFAVRRAIPNVPQRFVLRLPAPLRAAHEHWNVDRSEVGTSVLEELRRRSRLVAVALSEIGDSPQAIGDQLVAWGFHPSLASEATAWMNVATGAPSELTVA